MRGQGQHTLTQDIGILFHYGFMFYLVLVHCTKKFTSNGGVYHKEKKRAMTRGIEKNNLHKNASLFFKYFFFVGSEI